MNFNRLEGFLKNGELREDYTNNSIENIKKNNSVILNYGDNGILYDWHILQAIFTRLLADQYIVNITFPGNSYPNFPTNAVITVVARGSLIDMKISQVKDQNMFFKFC